MADVFSRQTEFGGAMSADSTTLSVSGITTGFIIQNVRIQYSQAVSRLYALEDGKVYFVAGQTDGQMTVSHLVGPQGLTTEFWAQYGDVCKERAAINIAMQGGCGTRQSRGKISLDKPILTTIGLSANSQNMQIISDLQLTFVGMNATNGAA